MTKMEQVRMWWDSEKMSLMEANKIETRGDVVQRACFRLFWGGWGIIGVLIVAVGLGNIFSFEFPLLRWSLPFGVCAYLLVVVEGVIRDAHRLSKLTSTKTGVVEENQALDKEEE